MNIYEKLGAIQQEIKVPKAQDNDFAGFKYRSAEDILEKLKPLLKKHKAVIVMSDKVAEVNQQSYIKATISLIDLEKPSDLIEAEALAREEKQRPKMSDGQLTGSASSYARKYALSGLLLLDDNKDPDSQNNAPEASKVAQKAKPDPLAKAKADLQVVLKNYGHDNGVKMKTAIHKVLGKSTIDSIGEANEVQQALEDGAI